MSEEAIVQICDTELEAVIVQQALKHAGVTAFVVKDDVGGMEPHLQRTNGVRLVVNRADAERAQQIIATLIKSAQRCSKSG